MQRVAGGRLCCGRPLMRDCTRRTHVRAMARGRYMLTTIIVVLGSISTAESLYADDLTGDRCAVLFIAFLILVTSMQQDLGLGELNYLIWLDVWASRSRARMQQPPASCQPLDAPPHTRAPS